MNSWSSSKTKMENLSFFSDGKESGELANKVNAVRAYSEMHNLAIKHWKILGQKITYSFYRE